MTKIFDSMALPFSGGGLNRPVGDNGLQEHASADSDPQHSPSEEPQPGSEISASDRRRAVLVVDDEPTVRLLITEVLNDLEYISLEAADGPSGLTILKSDAPIDLLITDVGLPGGMDGRELATAARAERPGLAILFITGYAENTVLGDAALETGILVLAKPFSIDALASHIKELTS